VLNPSLTVPEQECQAILVSLFAQQEAPLIDPEAARKHYGLIPFANPFGASVLRCGAEGCGESFSSLLEPGQVNGKTVNAIRDARTKHLISVFGIRGRFESSPTGLPERPDIASGQPPTSIHTNLHISIVRHWASHTQEQKAGIVADESAREEFIQGVTQRLCREGRGNVFQSGLDEDIRVLLPSFFDVLGKALKMLRRDGEGVEGFEHDFAENTMEGKVRWEMEAAR
jgi:hypothetical protein